MVTDAPVVTTGRRRLSAATVLAVAAAETVWAYLALLAIVPALGLPSAITPVVVLVPLGISMIATPVVGIWSHAGQRLSTVLLSAGEAGARVCRWASKTVRILSPVSAGMVYLSVAAATVVGTARWEIHRDLDPLGLIIGVLSTENEPPVTNPLFIFTICVGTVSWWRGASLSLRTESRTLIVRFAVGSGALLAVVGLGDSGAMSSNAGFALIAAYLVTGILALSSSRLDAAAADRVSPGLRYSLGVVATLLLLGGFGLAVWLMPWLGGPVRSAWDWVAGVLLPLVSFALSWIAHLLGLDQPPVPLPVDPSPGTSLVNGDRMFFTMPDEFRDTGRLLFNLSWLLMALYAVVVSVGRLLSRAKPGPGRIGSRNRLPLSVRLGFRQAIFHLWYGLAERWLRVLRLLRSSNAQDCEGGIREIYRWLLRWASSRGVAPEPWSTPREIKTTLASAWPHLESDFDLLTESYLRVRYGESSFEAVDIEAVGAGLKRIARDRSRLPRRDQPA